MRVIYHAINFDDPTLEDFVDRVNFLYDENEYVNDVLRAIPNWAIGGEGDLEFWLNYSGEYGGFRYDIDDMNFTLSFDRWSNEPVELVMSYQTDDNKSECEGYFGDPANYEAEVFEMTEGNISTRRLNGMINALTVMRDTLTKLSTLEQEV